MGRKTKGKQKQKEDSQDAEEEEEEEKEEERRSHGFPNRENFAHRGKIRVKPSATATRRYEIEWEHGTNQIRVSPTEIYRKSLKRTRSTPVNNQSCSNLVTSYIGRDPQKESG